MRALGYTALCELFSCSSSSAINPEYAYAPNRGQLCFRCMALLPLIRKQVRRPFERTARYCRNLGHLPCFMNSGASIVIARQPSMTHQFHRRDRDSCQWGVWPNVRSNAAAPATASISCRAFTRRRTVQYSTSARKRATHSAATAGVCASNLTVWPFRSSTWNSRSSLSPSRGTGSWDMFSSPSSSESALG